MYNALVLCARVHNNASSDCVRNVFERMDGHSSIDKRVQRAYAHRLGCDACSSTLLALSSTMAAGPTALSGLVSLPGLHFMLLATERVRPHLDCQKAEDCCNKQPQDGQESGRACCAAFV